MTLFYASITLAVLGSIAYHVIVKFTPAGVNPAVSLGTSYAVALGLCAALLLVFPLGETVIREVKKLNWASYALALALVGLEVGFLLAYRAGWKISTAAIIVNVAATLLLIPVGIFLFKERLSPVNIAGILVCLVGLVLVNLGR
jgi:drug/metabolite transporter (DMT)-like permease